jgi:hypothetical protein
MYMRRNKIYSPMRTKPEYLLAEIAIALSRYENFSGSKQHRAGRGIDSKPAPHYLLTGRRPINSCSGIDGR